MEPLRLLGRIILVLWLYSCSFSSYGQDPVMSQFSMNKPFLNPAYAGYGKDFVSTLQSRFQWTHVPGAFITNSLSADIGCPVSRLGFGVLFYDNYEGEGFLRNTQFSGQLSVNLPGKFKRFFGRGLQGKGYIFSAGLRFGIGQKTLDWSKLTFSDQYGIYTGFSGAASQVQPQNNESNRIFDLGAGIRGQIEFGKRGSFISLGTAVAHINRPVESFFGTENKLEMKFTFHAFTYFQTKKFTNKPDYLSIGIVSDYQQSLVTNNLLIYKDVLGWGKVGAGFRRQNFILIDKNVDAFILQGLITFKSLTFGYSYDFTISEFGPQRSYGTHEFGITFHLKNSSLCGGSRKEGKLDCFHLDSKRVNQKDFKIWNP